ncbi:MAG: hypothetical protein AVDCRST_MAG85-2144, partial [uncultured Solirubrobacteraceae bacterium]
GQAPDRLPGHRHVRGVVRAEGPRVRPGAHLRRRRQGGERWERAHREDGPRRPAEGRDARVARGGGRRRCQAPPARRARQRVHRPQGLHPVRQHVRDLRDRRPRRVRVGRRLGQGRSGDRRPPPAARRARQGQGQGRRAYEGQGQAVPEGPAHAAQGPAARRRDRVPQRLERQARRAQGRLPHEGQV